MRDQRVILDADLARLYGVTTKAFNQAVKRNAERFPDDFAFQLTSAELGRLRSQTVTSSRKAIGNQEGTDNWSQIVTSSRGGRRYRPWVFTEHGAVMAANILRSERAIHMSVFVVRAFVRLREHVAANAAILKRLAEIDRTLLEHDTALVELYKKLQPLLQPPPDPPNLASVSSRRGNRKIDLHSFLRCSFRDIPHHPGQKPHQICHEEPVDFYGVLTYPRAGSKTNVFD